MNYNLETVSKKGKMQGFLAALAANLAWGLMSPISKELMNTNLISPLTLAGVRIIGGALLFWLVSLIMPGSIIPRERIERCDYVKIIIASLLIITANQALFIIGIGYTSPIDSSVVSSMTPVFTMIFAALLIHERITPLKMLGVVIGFIGTLIFIFNGTINTAIHVTNPILGNSLCVIAQICAAVYYVVFKDIIGKYSPFTLMKWMFIIAAVSILPFTAADIVAIHWSSFPLICFADIVYIVVFATFMSYLLIPYMQRRLKPTVVAMFNYLQPVVSTFYSAIIGLAVITGMKVFSTLLIFLGVWIVTQSRNTQTWSQLLPHRRKS